MAFETSFGNNLGVLGDDALVMGTAVLGTAFGQVVTASVKRESEREEIENAGGNLRAVVLKKIRFTVTVECIFDTSVTPPGLLDQFDLPFAGVTGRVLSAEIKWERGKERMLSIEATHWDALATASGLQAEHDHRGVHQHGCLAHGAWGLEQGDRFEGAVTSRALYLPATRWPWLPAPCSLLHASPMDPQPPIPLVPRSMSTTSSSPASAPDLHDAPPSPQDKPAINEAQANFHVHMEGIEAQGKRPARLAPTRRPPRCC